MKCLNFWLINVHISDQNKDVIMSNEDGEMALVMHTCKVNMDTITW